MDLYIPNFWKEKCGLLINNLPKSVRSLNHNQNSNQYLEYHLMDFIVFFRIIYHVQVLLKLQQIFTTYLWPVCIFVFWLESSWCFVSFLINISVKCSLTFCVEVSFWGNMVFYWGDWTIKTTIYGLHEKWQNGLLGTKSNAILDNSCDCCRHSCVYVKAFIGCESVLITCLCTGEYKFGW